MVIKRIEKEKAIALREKGLSYSEILKEVSVAKSTLSLWLRSVGLSSRQKQRLTEKKLASMRKGWKKVHEMRLRRIEEEKTKAKKEVVKRIYDPLWLAGTMLYWAEGSKMKTWRAGERVVFSNMDPHMLILMKKWFMKYLEEDPKKITYDIYIHKNSENRLLEVREHWSKILNIPQEILRVYFKKNKINTKRKNTGNDYKGLIRMEIKKSSHLNHKITGWIEELTKYL